MFRLLPILLLATACASQQAHRAPDGEQAEASEASEADEGSSPGRENGHRHGHGHDDDDHHGHHGEDGHHHHNVLQDEMDMLVHALQRAVRAVGEGDVRRVAHDLHQLHGAMEATEAAIRDGSYTLPKNSDQVDAFLAMDEAFHQQLESMVAASQANDVPAMAQAIGTALNACNGCHTLFRD